MFDRFTDRARMVMGLARQEAQRFNHDYIGVEHVLLGLVDEGCGVAADVLKNLDVDPKRVRREVEKHMTPGTTMVTMGLLPFTPRARKMLELALEEASGLGHNYIGTEHLLLGLVREEKGIAAQVLRTLNLRLEDVREEISELLGQDDEGEEPVDTAGPLTTRARHAMELASLVAHHFQHEAIGTEHILIGIIDGGSGGSELPRLLLARLRAETDKLMTPGTAHLTRAPVALTTAARTALDHAFLAARDLGADRVDIGHLIAGLIRENDGIAARVLAAAGITPKEALDALPRCPPSRPAQAGKSGFDRFADRSRKALGLARMESQRLNHDYIGTEHVLLGVVAASTAANALLRKLGVDPERVRAETGSRLTPGKTPVTTGQLPFTPAAKRALELTLEEANALGHDSIREEHLLLGLAREGTGTAAQVLADLGVTVDALRREIAKGPPAPPE
jgi:ATP-dependent Clp protease ATP-binding subunit ClpA